MLLLRMPAPSEIQKATICPMNAVCTLRDSSLARDDAGPSYN